MSPRFQDSTDQMNGENIIWGVAEGKNIINTKGQNMVIGVSEFDLG